MARFNFLRLIQDHIPKIVTITLAILITIAVINNMVGGAIVSEPWILLIHLCGLYKCE